MRGLLASLALFVVTATPAVALDFWVPTSTLVVCDMEVVKELMDEFREHEDATALWKLQSLSVANGRCGYTRFPVVPVAELDSHEDGGGDVLTALVVSDGYGGLGYAVTFDPVFLSP